VVAPASRPAQTRRIRLTRSRAAVVMLTTEAHSPPLVGRFTVGTRNPPTRRPRGGKDSLTITDAIVMVFRQDRARCG
jgi:hypothetical protein